MCSRLNFHFYFYRNLLTDEIELHGSLKSGANNSLRTSAFFLSVATSSPFSFISDLSYSWPFFSGPYTYRIPPDYSSHPLPRSIPSVPCLSLSHHYTSKLHSCILSRSPVPASIDSISFILFSLRSRSFLSHSGFQLALLDFLPIEMEGKASYSKKSALKKLPTQVSFSVYKDSFTGDFIHHLLQQLGFALPFRVLTLFLVQPKFFQITDSTMMCLIQPRLSLIFLMSFFTLINTTTTNSSYLG